MFAFEVSDPHRDYEGFDPASFAQLARRDSNRPLFQLRR